MTAKRKKTREKVDAFSSSMQGRYSKEMRIKERPTHKEQRRPFRPRTEAQQLLYSSAVSGPMVIAVGPAGTGKSFTLVCAALDLYFAGVVDKIILTRPPEPVGGSTVGLFQGDLQKKMLNWLSPVLSQFVTALELSGSSNGESHLGSLMERVIQLHPLETMKGASFDRAFILVEEAQDCDLESLRVVCTRIGEGSILALNGDLCQVHVKRSGFAEFISRIEEYDRTVRAQNEEDRQDWQCVSTPVCRFCRDDIVRSGLTRKMVEIFY